VQCFCQILFAVIDVINSASNRSFASAVLPRVVGINPQAILQIVDTVADIT